MKPTKKSDNDTQQCPNCDKPITVPKSTRSFICRECDAILKVAETDAGLDLKVVGKSVEENDEYQELETQVTEVKDELVRMHRLYEREVNRPISAFPRVVIWLGLLAVPIGLAVSFSRFKVGLGIALLGIVLAVLFWVVRSSQKKARVADAQEIATTITELGSRRDLLQRKAARIKTQV